MSDVLENPQIPHPADASYRQISSRFGLITGLILIAISLASSVLGVVDYTQQGGASNWTISIISYAIVIGAMVMAIRTHRDDDLGGFISFGRAFGVSFLTGLIVAALTMVWTYLFFGFISPEILDSIQEVAREQMAEEQGMSEEQIEQGMSMMSFMFQPGGMAVMAGLGSLLFYSIFALIVSAVMKKDPPLAVSV